MYMRACQYIIVYSTSILLLNFESATSDGIQELQFSFLFYQMVSGFARHLKFPSAKLQMEPSSLELWFKLPFRDSFDSDL